MEALGQLVNPENLQSQKLQWLWICATRGSEKDAGMWASTQNGPYKDVAIVTSPAHVLEESHYNRFLSQKDGPALISVTKALQSSNFSQDHREGEQYLPPERKLHKKLTGLHIDMYGSRSDAPLPPIGKTIIVANDIVLHISKEGSTNWESLNKIPALEEKRADRSKILSLWKKLLTDRNISGHDEEGKPYIKVRFVCGSTAYDPLANRGAYGNLELFFHVEPFTDAQLESYYSKQTDSELLRTNGALDWVKDELFSHVNLIGRVKKDSPQFNSARSYFNRLLRGHLPGINDLIGLAVDFSDKNSFGSATSAVRELMKITIQTDKRKKISMGEILDSKGVKNTGKWTYWRPQTPF